MSLLNDESLNDAERQLIEAFERRSTGSVSPTDPGAPTSAEEEVDPVVPATSPGPAPESTDPSAAPSPPTQIEGSDDGGEENAPSPTATGDATGTPTGEGEVDQSAVAPGSPSDSTFTFAGVDYKPEELAQGIQLRNWYQSLNPQQLQSIDALLSGQYRLVPAHEATPTTPVQTAPPSTPANTPASSAAPAITDDDAGDWLDPRAQQEINALRSELANLQQSVQQSVSPLIQQQHDASINQTLTQIDNATSEFAAEYHLTPEQVEPIMRAVAEAQILPGLQAQHGSAKAAMRAGLDMMFWTTPSFREPYVQQKTAADLAALTAQQQTDKVKQQQMTALSASGGSVPRRDPKPTNKEDRHAAMVAEIAASQNGQ